MSAPLGPCPACGKGVGIEDPDDYSMAMCDFGCTYKCTREHWNTMRRKMTREDAEKMRQDVWAARRDMENAAVKPHDAHYCAALNEYKAAMRVIVDALVGYKT